MVGVETQKGASVARDRSVRGRLEWDEPEEVGRDQAMG